MSSFLRHALIAIAIAIALPAGPPAHAAPAGTLGGEVVLRLRGGAALDGAGRASGPASAQLDALLSGAGASAAREVGAGSATYRVRLRDGADVADLARRLAALPSVAFAEPNRLRESLLIPSDQLFGQQWALADIHAPEAWDITTGGAVPIAILDTGVSPTHLDLKGKLLPGYDFLNGDSDARDDDGHGTYTAGVAAAASDNGIGVAGVCWGCAIIPVKVLNRRGQGDDATIAQGIRWAADQGARIISMSLGGPEDTRVLREAVAYARDRGVLIVAASGNGQADGNLPSYPAAYAGVLAVSATRSDDTIASFSTSGSYVDIAAPGAGVLSTSWSVPDGDTYGVASGTSAACPHVAGAAGLVLTIRPDLTAEQLGEVLELAADDRGPPGRDPEYGFGRLNARRAVELAGDPDLLRQSRIEGAAPAGAVVALSDGRTAQADSGGFYRFSGLGPGYYSVSVSAPSLSLPARQVALSGTALSVATVDFRAAPDVGGAFAPVPPPAAGQGQPLYFAETGHTLRGAFRRFWEANGGLAIFGYPLSEELAERSDDGREHTVQYFQRHRLELHPESPPPYDVQLSRMGDLILQQQGRSWFAFPKADARPGCLSFTETGHTLCEPFLSYWQSHGLEFDGRRGKTAAESLALFGAPLSEPTVETTADGRPVLVQWFERARFEDHGVDGVLLGLLGDELARARGYR